MAGTPFRLFAFVKGNRARLVKRDLGRADSLVEAYDLAVGYLFDPRDAISCVHFFDERRQRFNGWLTLEAAEAILKERSQ